MLLHGEVGMLVHLTNLDLESNVMIATKEGREFAAITVWRRGDPEHAQPLFMVRCFVGLGLFMEDGIAESHVMIAANNHDATQEVWRQIPNNSFLKRGCMVEMVVDSFSEDPMDQLLGLVLDQ